MLLMSACGYQRTSGTMPAQFRFRVEIGHHDPPHSPSPWGVREFLDSGTPAPQAECHRRSDPPRASEFVTATAGRRRVPVWTIFG